MSGQKAHEMPADVTIAYFDLFPDGRVVANKSFGYRFDPLRVPRLPNDAEQAKSGWVSKMNATANHRVQALEHRRIARR